MTLDGHSKGNGPPAFLKSELLSPMCCSQLSCTQALLAPAAPQVSSPDQPREQSVKDVLHPLLRVSKKLPMRYGSQYRYR